MKKLLSLLLSLIMVMSLAACSNGGEKILRVEHLLLQIMILPKQRLPFLPSPSV